jgi:hypothetical protein
MYKHRGIDQLLLKENTQIPIISGGFLPPDIIHFYYERFLPLIHDYKENITVIEDYNNNKKSIRPYKFLFLNGRMRPHRKYLLEKFRLSNLLDQSLWSNLDDSCGLKDILSLQVDDKNLLLNSIPIHYLPAHYEIEQYRNNINLPFNDTTANFYAKIHLFQNTWGDIYLNLPLYNDTYFSLVTETAFSCPYTFRTEKLWKPVAIGHPFIVASTPGYYSDLHDIGFKTFGHLIDESFDTITDHQIRIERIAAVVEDLCKQDLPAFLAAAEETCKYNQQHLVEMRTKVRAEFPQRFENFINERFRI